MPQRRPLHRPPGVGSYVDRQRNRPSRHRIYGRRWQRLRAAYLASHPICECEEQCGRPATVVDHKKAHNGDLSLAFDWNNLQAMTKPCHDAKTARQDGGFGNPYR